MNCLIQYFSSDKTWGLVPRAESLRATFLFLNHVAKLHIHFYHIPKFTIIHFVVTENLARKKLGGRIAVDSVETLTLIVVGKVLCMTHLYGAMGNIM